MLRVPGQDWTSFFANAPLDWRVDVYTERQVRSLLDAGAGYDCVVVGYNAVHESPAIRAALAAIPLSTGLLALHRLDPDSLSFCLQTWR